MVFKRFLCLLFCGGSFVVFSQKKSLQKIESPAKYIEIATQGLDHITLENTTSRFVEVFLFDENAEKHHIRLSEKDEVLKIDFLITPIENEKPVFRKFITKRLQRAYAIVKIPKNKAVKIFGDHIDIASKNYKGDLSIYIEKGNVKLHHVQQNIFVKLYSGNIFATLQETNIYASSNLGKIIVNDIPMKKSYEKLSPKNAQEFRVETIKGNIFLSTEKAQ